MKKVVIIHGWGGKPEGCFKPWLKAELEKRGFEVVVPAMPNSENPKVSEWVDHLKEIVGVPDENLILVGHSLGCPTILKYLNSVKENEKIGGAVMVAGFARGLKYSEIKDFFLTSDEIEIAKKHCDKFITIASENDKLVPFDVSVDFHKELGSELVLEKNMGHFSDEDGVTELPSALSAVLNFFPKS